jgi:spermidine/putrescine transport system permease protein
MSYDMPTDAPLLRFTPKARFGLGWLSLLAYVFLYVPLAVLVIFSFSGSRILSYPMQSWTLDWYVALARDHEVIQSTFNSLIVAGAVVPMALIMGGLAAIVIDRFSFPGRSVYERLLSLPLMVPGLVTGLAILLLLKRVNMPLSLATVTLGHSIAWMPVVTLQVLARLRRFDRRLEEASMDLGAKRFETFRRITLPNLRTALLGSALLVFTLSFDEVAITFFLTGKANTLPMLIWSMLRTGLTPEINAVATITILISFGMIVLSLKLLNRSE